MEELLTKFLEENPHGIIILVLGFLAFLIGHGVLFLIRGGRNYKQTWDTNIRILGETVAWLKEEKRKFHLKVGFNGFEIDALGRVDEIPQPPGSKEKCEAKDKEKGGKVNSPLDQFSILPLIPISYLFEEEPMV